MAIKTHSKPPSQDEVVTTAGVSAIDWESEARQAVRALLARHGCSYKMLARRLEAIGVESSPRVLSNRVARGGFSFAFVMQVAHAVGVELIDVRPAATPAPRNPSEGDAT